MLMNQASAATATSLIDAASCAATANATSGTGKWLDVRAYDGEILVTQQIGAVTGSITGKLQSATDANGTGAADISGYTFGTNTANSTSTLTAEEYQLAALVMVSCVVNVFDAIKNSVSSAVTFFSVSAICVPSTLLTK